MSRRLKILSSDDDEGIRALLFSLLGEQGHDVEFARDSEEVFKNLGRTRYDLLILDVNTPGMNGYKVAEKITENLANRPRILIFTARDIKAEEFQFMSSGADAIVHKGASCDALLKTVDELFREQPAADCGGAKEVPQMTETSKRTISTARLNEDLKYCLSKLTSVEDDMTRKNLRYEEFIRELLKEKQRTEKNYLEFKRIEGEVSKIRNWGYAVAACAGLAVLRSFI